MREYLKLEEFEQLKRAYQEENDRYDETVIFHVGSEAGFYSEVGSMLECMCFCHMHKKKFVLYADDANFTSGKGWNVFFDTFCRMDHNPLNHKYNLRYPVESKFALWNQKRLLKKSKANYLTNEFFQEFISSEFKKQQIDWPLFDMHGTVYPEMAKLMKLALRYREDVYQEILSLIDTVQLPQHYMSIQMRGGDKIEERTKLYGALDCIQRIERTKMKVKDLFVFTDDYRNIETLKKERPEWNIYTLTGKEETGYNNGEFNARKWKEKRKDLIKMFAMVEICINSDMHFGNEHSCANNIIMNSKKNGQYYPLISFEEDRLK